MYSADIFEGELKSIRPPSMKYNTCNVELLRIDEGG
jgi:hypothetical protein